MLPGSALALEIGYSEIGQLEITLDGKFFTIWLWGGCRVAVSLDGKDHARPSMSIPVP